MPKNTHCLLAVAGCLLAMVSTCVAAADAPEVLSFEQHVRPIFKAYCFECHGAGEKVKGGLDLRLRRFLVRGGDTGAVIVPGEPAKSLLLSRLKSGEMPPSEKKVPAEKIAIIERWLTAGAVGLRPEPEKLAPGTQTGRNRVLPAPTSLLSRLPPCSRGSLVEIAP